MHRLSVSAVDVVLALTDACRGVLLRLLRVSACVCVQERRRKDRTAAVAVGGV